MDNFKAIGTNPLTATKILREFFNKSKLLPGDMVMILCVVSEDELASSKHKLPVASPSTIGAEAKNLYNMGIRAVKIFAKGYKRDFRAKEALSSDNIMHLAIKSIKNTVPDMCVITETCLCSYTLTHSCVLHNENGKVDLKGTTDIFGEIAVLQAYAGADIVGPAANMPQTVKSVRRALNENGFDHIAIVPHFLFKSSLYSLYRTTMNTNTDRSGFHTDSSQEGYIVQVARELADYGANAVMLEPGLFYLHHIHTIKRSSRLSVGVFSSSGEYETLFLNYKNSGNLERGYELLLEYFYNAKTAGAHFIASYAAKEIMSRI